MITIASAGKPETIIVVSYGGFGDILLTTPLIASLRQRFPRAAIDVYVQKNRGGILEGNPHVTRVFTERWRHGIHSYLDFLRQFAGCYDLAVSTRNSDRQISFARLAGRTAISLVNPAATGARWKKALLSGWVTWSGNVHCSHCITQLTRVIGIAASYECVPPFDAGSGDCLDLEACS